MRSRDRENRALWDEWSDEHQAMWNGATDNGRLPPTYSPVSDADSLEEWQADGLPEISDIDFIELGCGGGQGTVGAAQDGVQTAVGVDFSTRQLDHARRLRNLYGVDAEFVAGDVTSVPVADDSFDLAHSGFVYFMVADIDAAFREADRVLRPGGYLCFDVPHPVHELFDPETIAFERSYHDTGPRRDKHDQVLHEDIIVIDRTVSDLHNALVDAGFTVAEMWEWPRSDDPSDYDEDDRSSSPALKAKVPRTLGFRAVAE